MKLSSHELSVMRAIVYNHSVLTNSLRTTYNPPRMTDINHPTITTNGVVRPTLVEVDLTRLAENFRAIQE